MDDEPEELQCPECDFRFSVVWSMDYERSNLPIGTQVICYCPACGEELDEIEGFHK